MFADFNGVVSDKMKVEQNADHKLQNESSIVKLISKMQKNYVFFTI